MRDKAMFWMSVSLLLLSITSAVLITNILIPKEKNIDTSKVFEKLEGGITSDQSPVLIEDLLKNNENTFYFQNNSAYQVKIINMVLVENNVLKNISLDMVLNSNEDNEYSLSSEYSGYTIGELNYSIEDKSGLQIQVNYNYKTKLYTITNK